MKAVWVWLCGGYECLILLQPTVPRSKIAAGHVGVALLTSGCQVGLQISRFVLCRGTAYQRVGRVLYLALIGTYQFMHKLI